MRIRYSTRWCSFMFRSTRKSTVPRSLRSMPASSSLSKRRQRLLLQVGRELDEHVGPVAERGVLGAGLQEEVEGL